MRSSFSFKVLRGGFLTILMALLGLAMVPAQAQVPGKPLKLVVPWPAGGAADWVGRHLQMEIARTQTEPVLVENIPGAGGLIGMERYLARPADERGLFVGSNSDLITSLLTTPAAKVKPEDFRLLSIPSSAGFSLAVRADLPVSSVEELVAYAKARPPGTLKMGHNGAGSLVHLTTEDFCATADISVLQVPYKGFVEIMRDLSAGEIDAAFIGLNAAIMSNPKLKVLATSMAQRHPRFPQLPAINESAGFKNFKAEGWFAMVVTRNTAPTDVARLEQLVNQAVYSENYLKAGKEYGQLTPPRQSLAELDRFYIGEIDRYRALIKRLHLSPES